jgi:hypothetical protein
VRVCGHTQQRQKQQHNREVALQHRNSLLRHPNCDVARATMVARVQGQQQYVKAAANQVASSVSVVPYFAAVML